MTARIDRAWRQGSLLSHAASVAIGLVNQDDTNKRTLVISHDCDLHNEIKEDFIEVVTGEIIEKCSSDATGARNVRLLHLTYADASGADLCVAITHAGRTRIHRSLFIEHQQLDVNASLDTDELHCLCQWLAARYARPAFPDAFEERLRKQVPEKKRGQTVEKVIQKIFSPVHEDFAGVFLHLPDEQRQAELEDGEPYLITLYIVYKSEPNPETARAKAEQAASELCELFRSAYGEEDKATEIVLEECKVVSDMKMSLHDLMRIPRWRLEYMSAQAEPMDDFLPAGAV
jgi:hypothetical protein